jgi:hypothetical protein
MWKYSLESLPGSDTGELSASADAGHRRTDWRRRLAEAALLLGMLLTSSWLICR